MTPKSRIAAAPMPEPLRLNWRSGESAVPVMRALPLSVPASARSGATALAIESGRASIVSAMSSASPALPVAVIRPPPTSSRTVSSVTRVAVDRERRRLREPRAELALRQRRGVEREPIAILERRQAAGRGEVGAVVERGLGVERRRLAARGSPTPRGSRPRRRPHRCCGRSMVPSIRGTPKRSAMLALMSAAADRDAHRAEIGDRCTDRSALRRAVDRERDVGVDRAARLGEEQRRGGRDVARAKLQLAAQQPARLLHEVAAQRRRSGLEAERRSAAARSR